MDSCGEVIGCHRLSAPPFINLDDIDPILLEWVICVKKIGNLCWSRSWLSGFVILQPVSSNQEEDQPKTEDKDAEPSERG